MTALRICFVGDSITTGAGDDACLGWPGRLCAAERAAGHDVTVYNLGIRAETSEDIARRWEAECRPRLPDVFAGGLVFAFGVNDMAAEPATGVRVPLERSLANARTILSAAREWRPTLWVGLAPADMDRQPLSPGPGVEYDFDNARARDLNARYADLAAELDVSYLDLFDGLARDARWSRALAEGDGVHPAADGYAALAERVGGWPAWRAWFDQ